MKPAGLMVAIGKGAPPDDEDEDAGVSEEDMEEAASTLMGAIKAGDAAGVSAALSAFLDLHASYTPESEDE